MKSKLRSGLTDQEIIDDIKRVAVELGLEKLSVQKYSHVLR